MRKPVLRLNLDPIVPVRRPLDPQEGISYGYELRLPGGPRLGASDPLLAAYGVVVADVEHTSADAEDLQHPSFDPGCRLDLQVEADEEPGEVVSVWESERLRRAGVLPPNESAIVLAGSTHGVDYSVVALQEWRAPPDGRRTGLSLAVFPPAVRLSTRRQSYLRREHRQRERLLLVADGSSPLRWWGAALDDGPAEIDQVPTSAELKRELLGLRDASFGSGSA